LRDIGVRVIAIPLSGTAGPADAELGSNGGSIVAITQPDTIKAYMMFARQDIDAANAAAPVHVDYLIDRQGYVRARWIGIPDSPPSRVADIFDQSDVLRRERQRPPPPLGHTH